MATDFSIVKRKLEARGYKVSVFATKEEAARHIDSEIDGTTVGIGGSASVNESGLYDLLKTHNEVYWHWVAPDGSIDGDYRMEQSDRSAALKKAMDTECYICSANALSEDGMMVNIDGRGNRLASTVYGHKRLFYLIGRNKLTKDLDSAIERARNYASPRRVLQNRRNGGCALAGKLECIDCLAKQRACRAMTIYYMPMNGQEVEIVLVDEDLGL